MLDLNNLRREFATFISADQIRWRMDAALAHVCALAYRKGIEDGMSSSDTKAETLMTEIMKP